MWRRRESPPDPGVRIRRLGVRERSAAVDHLGRSPEENLFLLDLAAGLGAKPAPGEAPAELLGAWRHDDLVGVLSLRPCVMIDSASPSEVLEAFLPHLASLKTGLVKSSVETAGRLWEELASHGRCAVLDRVEHAFRLRPHGARLVEPPPGLRVRPAANGDLEELVMAARESLREEQRPDPFSGDPAAFREWVRGRTDRARVVETEGRIVFAGYADVRRPQGWLLQGIYTWPELRRRGFAAAGVSSLCVDAFAAGANHVQLSVVEGNVAATRLYERLGFLCFARFRTVLFG